MDPITFIQALLDAIDQVAEHVRGSIIYLDAGCTECFKFGGVFSLLLEHGARAICSLESMCSLDMVADWNLNYDFPRKIVIMTSRLLSDAHRYILRCLKTHWDVHYCTIFTSVSETAHSACPDSPLGPDAFLEYQLLLVEDLKELVRGPVMKCSEPVYQHEGNVTAQNKEQNEEVSHPISKSGVLFGRAPTSNIEDGGLKVVVSVRHFPLLYCPFSRRVFVLPSEGSVAQAVLSRDHANALCPGLPPVHTELSSYGDDLAPGAIMIAHFLYDLASKMDWKLEIFSLGSLSKAVGKILTDMSGLYEVSRHKRSVGLLIIDRTLDLLTPCCHGDSLVDRIFGCSSRRASPPFSLERGSEVTTANEPVRSGYSRIDIKIPILEILHKEGKASCISSSLQSIQAFDSGWNSDVLPAELLIPTETDFLAGSFISPDSTGGTHFLDEMLYQRTKDGAQLAKTWLEKAILHENIDTNAINHAGLSMKSELQAMISTISRRHVSLIKNKGVLQVAAATVKALEELNSARWDAFASAEKVLSVNAGGTSQNLAAQIVDLINKVALDCSRMKKCEKMVNQNGLLSLEDMLFLTVIGYILAGENFPSSGSGSPFTWQEEFFMKEAIVDAIFENPPKMELKFLHDLSKDLEANARKTAENSQVDEFDDQWGSWDEEDEDGICSSSNEKKYSVMQLKLELRDRLEVLFKFFHKLSNSTRCDVFSNNGMWALENASVKDACRRKGLLYKVLTSIFKKSEVPGLEHHSSTVGRIFKSSFRKFGLAQTKPSLVDQNAIFVFILGGINGVEVVEAEQALSENGREDVDLILGGTALLSPDDMFNMLFGSSSFM